MIDGERERDETNSRTYRLPRSCGEKRLRWRASTAMKIEERDRGVSFERR